MVKANHALSNSAQNVIYKAKRKLSLANLGLKTFFFHVTEFFV